MDHKFWQFLGWAAGLIITMGAVYAIYAKSLSNKKSVRDLARDLEATARDLANLRERVERNEKQDEKRDAAIEKLADRVYDQK